MVIRNGEEGDIFQTGSSSEIWQKYCGFLDLSLPEFMEIQERLLLEDIELITNTPVGSQLMKGKVPTSVAEFRQTVPLTTYEDYASYLGEGKDDTLPEKPYCWGHTSGRSGSFKWVPFSERAYECLGDAVAAGLILASAARKGEVNFKKGDRAIYNTPPRPYISGIAAYAGAQRLGLQFVPPLELSEKMDFEQRIEEGFRMSLRLGADFLGSMTSILIKVGEGFTDRSAGMKLSRSMLHPAVLFRIARAIIRSKIERRAILPKDLWPVKAVLCGGMDTAIHKDRVKHYWGRLPYEYYACTEGGIIALQTWNDKGMVFTPYSVFLEFIPEEEWLKNREQKEYTPSTVLLDEVEEGERYELVMTSFYGMPFLRYRPGDLLRIVSLKDKESGINLPHMIFEARADDIIDIAGFTRLDEKTGWQAIANSGVNYEDWTIRKEYAKDKPVLHLYIELKDRLNGKDVENLIHDNLKAVDNNYNNLEAMLGIRPLKVTLLSRGTFERYYREKQAAGMDLAHLKPPHINAFDGVIESLLRLSRGGQA